MFHLIQNSNLNLKSHPYPNFPPGLNQQNGQFMSLASTILWTRKSLTIAEYLKCRKCVQIDFLSVNTIYVIRTIHGWLKQFIYYFKKNWGQSNPLRSQLQRKLTCLRENYMAHAILLLSEVNYLKSQKTNIFTFGQDKQALVFCYQNRSDLLWEKKMI